MASGNPYVSADGQNVLQALIDRADEATARAYRYETVLARIAESPTGCLCEHSRDAAEALRLTEEARNA